FKIMESSANGWDVSYNTYTASQLTSYSPRWYVKVTNSTVTPNFTSNVKSGCSGVTIKYTDASTSTGTINAWKWTFQGGSPATSSSQNPSVTYSTPGTYNVTEVVTSTTGVDSITSLAYVNVIPVASLPLTETFESGSFPPTGWTLNKPSPDDSVWQLCPTTGYSSAKCMFFPANCGQTIDITGERQQLYTPNYSFTGVTNAELSFDVAYEPSSVTGTRAYSDTLVVYYSTDCGNTWNNIYMKGGMTLCTTGSTTTAKTDVNSAGCFVPPSNSAWRRDSVSLAAVNNQSSVMFSFECRSGWGNIIYVDNINVAATSPTSIQAFVNSTDVKVYPNPTNGSFNIALSGNVSEKADLDIFDALGQQVSHSVIQQGTNQLSLEGKATGIYFYRVMTADGGKLISEGKLMLQK
ncbi:MAG TPA: T9SS type A sorting domain-containing protein, partial [Bacteroidia bacterium]|nr:T9SS type A sorting domain-containing protein [Bacteroidia bacterium]